MQQIAESVGESGALMVRNIHFQCRCIGGGSTGSAGGKDRLKTGRQDAILDAIYCTHPMTRRTILSLLAAPGVQIGYRDYPRCLPDYLRELAQRAYLARNRELAKLTN